MDERGNVPEWDTLINLTPHEVAVLDAHDRVIARIPVSDSVARLEEVRTPLGALRIEDGTAIPFDRVSYTTLNVDLPEPSARRFYIVSRLTAFGASERDDILVPLDEVRDSAGVIIGCRGFGRL